MIYKGFHFKLSEDKTTISWQHDSEPEAIEPAIDNSTGSFYPHNTHIKGLMDIDHELLYIICENSKVYQVIFIGGTCVFSFNLITILEE